MTTRGLRRLLSAAAIVAAGALAAPAQAATVAPILVVTNPADPIGQFYPEILRAEGLNEFDTASVEALSPDALASRQVVLLASGSLTDAQAQLLRGWVGAGGDLIAFRPDAKLAGTLGLARAAGEQPGGYLGAAASAGITTDKLQVHAPAQRWSLAGARRIATLYSAPGTATAWPAVALNDVGTSGGQAATFSFDLARTIVSTRQGNSEWVGQERDGAQPSARRSTDLFFPDWIDFGRIRIPQADELQRLLANLITTMAQDRMPMPRFWYLPRGEKAAVVLTGDDHGNGGTAGQFDLFEAASPTGCSVAEWQCVRATSYMYPRGPLTAAKAAGYQAAGFELSLHLDTSCVDRTRAQLDGLWNAQLGAFASLWPALAAPATSRTHCAAWDGWTTTAEAERAHGIRLDANYYYWPGTWVQKRPGFFTGSGFPMRFAAVDGSPVDVYQAATQITDEWPDESIAAHIKALLGGALGAEGYYGVITANMHTDEPSNPGANAIVSEALARGVPVVSAAQMLAWLDGRNASSFRNLRFANRVLSFSVDAAPGARGLEAMVPATGLRGVTRNGAPVAVGERTVKGIPYAVFSGADGAYEADYRPAPAVQGPAPSPAAPTTPASPKPAVRDRSRPRAKLKTRTAGVGRRGRIALRVSCPSTEIRCRVALQLRRNGKTVDGARDGFTVAGGKTARIAVRLPRTLKALVARRGSLRVVVVLRVKDAAGNRRTTRQALRLLRR